MKSRNTSKGHYLRIAQGKVISQGGALITLKSPLIFTISCGLEVNHKSYTYSQHRNYIGNEH
jgi:hypothetical protein